METLVCRQTLAGHKHDVLCLSGLHLSLLPKVDSSATGMGGSKAAEVTPFLHMSRSACCCECAHASAPLQQLSHQFRSGLIKINRDWCHSISCSQ